MTHCIITAAEDGYARRLDAADKRRSLAWNMLHDDFVKAMHFSTAVQLKTPGYGISKVCTLGDVIECELTRETTESIRDLISRAANGEDVHGLAMALVTTMAAAYAETHAEFLED